MENTDREKKEYDADGSDYIDVAKNAAYQNQSKYYYNEFLNWRSSGNNPYAYSFVRRKNEHSYIDGQGFVSKTPEDAEKRVLSRCCRLISMTMFTVIFFWIAEIIYTLRVGDFPGFCATKLPYGEEPDPKGASLGVCAVICGIRVLRYLVPIAIFLLDTKLPKAVMLPRSDKKLPDMTACAFVISLMTGAFCLCANDLMSAVMGKLGLTAYRFDYMYSNDPLVTLLFGAVHCVVISVLTEVLFRGLILQTFRQFGDMFAFIVCVVAETFGSPDMSSLGYTAFIGIIITLFTLRTGSILTAIGMKITTVSYIYIMDTVRMYMPQGAAQKAECIASFIVIAVSLVIYARLTSSQNFSFNIDNSRTHLSLERKLVIFLSKNSVMLWLIIILTCGFFFM